MCTHGTRGTVPVSAVAACMYTHQSLEVTNILITTDTLRLTMWDRLACIAGPSLEICPSSDIM